MPRDGFAVGLSGRQLVFGSKDVEIALRHSDDEVLLRRLANGLRFRYRFVSTSQVDDLVPAKQGLSEVNTPVRVGGVLIEGPIRLIDNRETRSRGVRVIPTSCCLNLWQQNTAGLWLGLK